MKTIARSRFESYCESVTKVHAISDEVGLAILCATQCFLYDYGPVGPPIILETDFFSVINDTLLAPVWFNIWQPNSLLPGSFGSFSLPFARRTRPRYDNGIVDRLLEYIGSRAFPFVLVEPEYTEPRNRPHQYSELYPILIDSCLRLRVPMPKSGIPHESDVRELEHTKSRLMQPDIRDPIVHPNATAHFIEGTHLSSPQFLHKCELAFKASGKLRDWNSLTRSLGRLDQSLRFLFNEATLPTAPYLNRALHDLVPVWVCQILEAGDKGFKTWKFAGKGSVFAPWKVEINRLKEQGLICFSGGQTRLWFTTDLGREVLQLLS